MNDQNNGGFLRFSETLRAEFFDDAEWLRLCDRTRYILPDWSVSPTRENIRLWLNRLDIREVDYREAMQTSVADMIELNPTWPLRAFVGLLLEYRFTGIPEAV